jgi:uncharacterized membrane protein YdfJ with MMPL/SSD domain
MTKETSSKGNDRKTAANQEAIVLTPEDLNAPEIKLWLKKKSEKQEEESRKKHLPAILKVAEAEIGKKFESINQLVKYFQPKQRKKRGKQLSDAEKKKIGEMNKGGKQAIEIATEMKKKPAQIYRYLATLKG